MSAVEAVDQLSAIKDQIYAEVGKVIIGQKQVVEELLIALLSGGHCLLVGVPGLAKPTLIQPLARTLALSVGWSSVGHRMLKRGCGRASTKHANEVRDHSFSQSSAAVSGVAELPKTVSHARHLRLHRR